MNPAVQGIYPILDLGPLLAPAELPAAIAACAEAAIEQVQLRAKSLPLDVLLEHAHTARKETRRYGIRLFINDHPELALLVEADGVHLGQSDLSYRRVRPWLPEALAIGTSCHDLSQLENAEGDYAGYGPIFATQSKIDPDPVVGLEGLRAACAHSPRPIVAIGGLNISRLPAVRAAGATSAALLSDWLRAPDRAAHLARAVAAFAG